MANRRSPAHAVTEPAALPLLPGPAGRTLLWRDGRAIDAASVLARARHLADRLGDAPHVFNLCSDRGHFLLGFCAALLAGRTTLLPPSLAPQVLAEIADDYAPASRIDDADVAAAIAAAPPTVFTPPPPIPDDRVVAIGFTSGSTGRPRAHAKTWGAFGGSTRRNLDLLRRHARGANVLATVPSQHMYGMETSVLLPLLGDITVACDRPLYPQDLADALARLPAPRVLVTTPVHLRCFVASGLRFPDLAAIICATAPLTAAAAAAAEQAFGAPLLELFGATESCVIAHRQTARERDWQLYPGLRLAVEAAGTRVHADYLPEAPLLGDRVRLLDGGRFAVEGRCQDLIEIAGKRASLGDITQRLLAVPGIRDAAAIQAEACGESVARTIGVIVADPALPDAAILAQLRQSLDPVFLPRRLLRVPQLPRNETGKLRRDDLLALLA